MKPDVRRKYKKTGETLSTAWVCFVGCEELIDYHKIPDYKIFKIPEALMGAQKQMLDMSHNGSNDAVRSAMMYSWLIDALECMLNEDKTIYAIIDDYMKENFHKKITLEKLAAIVGINKFALCRYYKKENLGSVMDQLCQIRLNKAKAYLANTPVHISDIASYCGFSDASYFGKVFKEKLGVSPKTYRATYSKLK